MMLGPLRAIVSGGVHATSFLTPSARGSLLHVASALWSEAHRPLLAPCPLLTGGYGGQSSNALFWKLPPMTPVSWGGIGMSLAQT